MPDYITNGKDVEGECSIKVSAFTDLEALHAAKRKIPVVSSLERIEPDGSLWQCRGLPFDDLHQDVHSPDERHRLHGEQHRRDYARWIKPILLLAAFLGFSCITSRCAMVTNQDYVQPR